MKRFQQQISLALVLGAGVLGLAGCGSSTDAASGSDAGVSSGTSSTTATQA